MIPKQIHGGGIPPAKSPMYAIDYRVVNGELKPTVVPYDFSLHKFWYKWPMTQTLYTKTNNSYVTDSVYVHESIDPNQSLSTISGTFCYPTTFLFKERYKLLKERGYHCGGIDITKQCAIMYFKKENMGNTPLRMILKFNGDFVFWVAKDHTFTKDGEKEQLLDSLLNVIQMFQ